MTLEFVFLLASSAASVCIGGLLEISVYDNISLTSFFFLSVCMLLSYFRFSVSFYFRPFLGKELCCPAAI